MKQYTSVVFSCLVFLGILFLSKTILTALETALFFLLLMTFLEMGWYFRGSSWFPLIIKPATNLLTTAILTLSFYALVFLPLEYQVTESWKFAPKIPFFFSFSFLFLLVVFLSLVDWSRFLKVKMFRFLFLVFVLFCGLVYRGYRSEKLAREYLPKIYKVRPRWGIQASLVKIEGVNFFPIWKKGKVILGDGEMTIKSWDEKLIVAEQGVPSRFGPTSLYLKRSDGIVSNSIPFEIIDPDDLRISN